MSGVLARLCVSWTRRRSLPVDEDEMERLRGEFPPDDLEKYARWKRVRRSPPRSLMPRKYSRVSSSGRMTARKYSVGNLKKELAALLTKAHRPRAGDDQYGADEIALSMLAQLSVDELRTRNRCSSRARIALRYARADMADMIFRSWRSRTM